VLHGIQLARTRPVVGRNLVGATFSFTRFLRSWRSRGSVRREICQSVAGSLLIDTTPREAAESEQQAVALNILFGAGGRRNPFRDVVRSTLETLSRPPTELRIRLPAAAADRPRWDIVTEVTVEVLNALLSKSWVVGSEGRWTHTLRILARFVVGCLLGGLLPAALEGARARAFAGVSMDLESQLAAQVAKELGEQTEASRKLRLLRLCKNLCTPEARWQAAVLVTALRPLDDFMYFVRGAGSEVRPTLLDLLGLGTPRFAELLGGLWALLCNFGTRKALSPTERLIRNEPPDEASWAAKEGLQTIARSALTEIAGLFQELRQLLSTILLATPEERWSVPFAGSPTPALGGSGEHVMMLTDLLLSVARVSVVAAFALKTFVAARASSWALTSSSGAITESGSSSGRLGQLAMRRTASTRCCCSKPQPNI